ncbi:hypothetical protein ASG01_09855 [Chryseobacterium sp. Leaf180]|uniref:hypothetical protein n=1 Tax=Chryseobacterium sp. Leaf180 TaxID=1736289 RepID=UPI0006FEA455|nr:hypothetical protein [Chryseobacterium sp. Leaf180]KQR93476.1 hypothetical protein ASG01_09855 [Chryseobacterium sp. Leaf180]
MRIITTEDFRDAQIKILQRGFKFFTSKFNLKSSYRTKSSFNDAELQTANWWIIPKVQERWNKLITGNKDLAYEEFFCRNFFPGHHPMKMLSIGSGVCGHEIKIAELMSHWEVHCFDFSEKLLQQAKITRIKRI